MSKLQKISKEDMEQIGELKCKISDCKNLIFDYEWELQQVYRKNRISGWDIRQVLKDL